MLRPLNVLYDCPRILCTALHTDHASLWKLLEKNMARVLISIHVKTNSTPLRLGVRHCIFHLTLHAMVHVASNTMLYNKKAGVEQNGRQITLPRPLPSCKDIRTNFQTASQFFFKSYESLYLKGHQWGETSHFHCSPISVTYRTAQIRIHERFIMYSVPEARPELPSRSSADVHLFILQVREKAVICNGLFHPKQT